jgi:hypothetical protein
MTTGTVDMDTVTDTVTATVTIMDTAMLTPIRSPFLLKANALRQRILT